MAPPTRPRYSVVMVFVVVLGSAAAFVVGPRGVARRRVVSQSRSPATPQKKWQSQAVSPIPIDDFAERLESVKTAVVAGLAASVAATPLDLVLHAGRLPQSEFNLDTLSLMGALFGVVFRYAVREDANPQLRQGVVGAFALTRALSSVRVSPACTFAPLTCGPPFSYLDWDMTWQLGSSLVESGLAFYAAAAAIDYCVDDRNWLKRFPSASETSSSSEV